VQTAQQLVALVEQDDRGGRNKLGRGWASAMRVRGIDGIPLCHVRLRTHKACLTPATANKSLIHWERIGVVTELASQKRNRLFSYFREAAIMGQGNEPLGCYVMNDFRFVSFGYLLPKVGTKNLTAV
jgi:hypothetical protein